MIAAIFSALCLLLTLGAWVVGDTNSILFFGIMAIVIANFYKK